MGRHNVVPVDRNAAMPSRPHASRCREDHPGVLEGIGDDKIRVNSSSLDNPVTILADQGIEIVGIEKKVMEGRTMRSAYWLNHDPSGLVDSPKGWREIAGERECLHYKKEPD
jgi:hypothetical protein